jgi:hypothetical protein
LAGYKNTAFEEKMTSHKHSDKQSIDIFIEDFEFLKEGMQPECDCSTHALCVNELVRAYRYCASHNISFPRDKHGNILPENKKITREKAGMEGQNIQDDTKKHGKKAGSDLK